MSGNEETIKIQLLAPKREIDELCKNTLTDMRTQAVMIAVRTYNRQHGEAGRGAEDPGEKEVS